LPHARQVLSRLVDLVAAELSRRLRGAGEAAAAVAGLQAQLASQRDELAQLHATLK
jgi:cell division protein FtsB